MAFVSLMIQLPSLNISESAVHGTVPVRPSHGGMHTERAEIQLHPFLTLALHGSKWSVSGPSHSTPEEITGGCVGPKSWCGHCEDEKINLLSLPGIKPWTVAQSLYY